MKRIIKAFIKFYSSFFQKDESYKVLEYRSKTNLDDKEYLNKLLNSKKIS
jgi:hypothetical protein